GVAAARKLAGPVAGEEPRRVQAAGREEEHAPPAAPLERLSRMQRGGAAVVERERDVSVGRGGARVPHPHAASRERIEVCLEVLRIELVARGERPGEADLLARVRRGDVVVEERAHGSTKGTLASGGRANRADITA